MSVLRKAWIAPALLTFACTVTSERQAKPPLIYAAPQWELNESLPIEDQVQNLENFLNDDNSVSMKWWVRYRQASLLKDVSHVRSCELFTWLAQQRQFPLKKVAHLRAIQNCENAPELSKPKFKAINKEKWLRNLSLEAQLKQAMLEKNHKDLMIVYHNQSKWSFNKKEKIELTRKAAHHANKAGDHAFEEQMNKRVYQLSPRLNKNRKSREALNVADDHRYHREFKQAKEIYDSVAANKRNSIKVRYRALLGMRKTYRLKRDKENELEATKKLARFMYPYFKKNPKKFAGKYKSAVLLLTRTLWTQGNPKAATNLLRNLSDELKGHTSLESIFWLRGRIEEEAKRHFSAIRWFDRALSECSEKCSKKDRLLWYKAWNLKKTKQFGEAYATLSHLYETGSEDLHPKVLFWRGKTLLAKGDVEEGKNLLYQAREADPYGYYGIMAQRELYSSIEALKEIRNVASLYEASRDEFGTPFNETKNGFKTSWLLAVGENDLAKRLLDDSTRSLIKNHPNDFKLWKDVSSYYMQAGAHQNLTQLLWRLPESTRVSILQTRPEMLFPKPFKEIVEREAGNNRVPSELIYSIMRQESAFDKNARSPADAFGLMQIIPSLASSLATREQVPFENADDLFDPDVNIALGSAHLKDLWQKYNGQFVLMTASYNASERALRGWVKHRYQGDPLQFIEDIPYRETKKYVKLVLRNFVLYQRLNSDESKMPFPEWCLQNIQNFKI